MKFVIYFKKDADLQRIADYTAGLPLKADFEDVLEKIEIVEEG